jgi:hypothetical protein
MNTAFRPFACLLLVCAACERSAPPPAPEPPVEPVAKGTPLRFTGEVVLAGPLLRATDGVVLLSLRRVGGTQVMWRRAYELGDPWWTQSAGSRSLPFGLSEKDAILDPAPTLSAEMEIVARYDPDGVPDTFDPGAVELVTRARTGETDLVITLGRPQGNLRPGPDISQTTGDLAPIDRPGTPR